MASVHDGARASGTAVAPVAPYVTPAHAATDHSAYRGSRPKQGEESMIRGLPLPPSLLRVVLVALALALAGCTVHGRGRAVVTTTSNAPPPTLVEISPGIWVVERHDAAVFYSDGYYWRWSSAGWYRTSTFHSGWVRVRATAVPARVRRIDRPRTYIRYRAPRGARVRVATPSGRRTVVRGRGRDRQTVRVRDRRTRREVEVRDRRSRPTRVEVRDRDERQDVDRDRRRRTDRDRREDRGRRGRGRSVRVSP